MLIGRRILVVIVLLATFALTYGCKDSRGQDSDAIPNVRLGMAPRDVRDRFQPTVEGSWQTAVGIGDDTVLEWTSRDPKSAVAQARFEFHLGMLVAIRARMNEAPPSSDRVSATAKTVTLRSAAAREGGTSVTVLARDCPTHKDEAEALVARASSTK